RALRCELSLRDRDERGAMTEGKERAFFDHSHVMIAAQCRAVSPLADLQSQAELLLDLRQVPLAVHVQVSAERGEHQLLDRDRRSRELVVCGRSEQDQFSALALRERSAKWILKCIARRGAGFECRRIKVASPDDARFEGRSGHKWQRGWRA